jgi:hypothetical protein
MKSMGRDEQTNTSKQEAKTNKQKIPGSGAIEF